MKEEMENVLSEEQEGLLSLSCDSIEQEVRGDIISGSFSVYGPKEKKIKGKVMASDPRVVLGETVIQSEKLEISYSFDGYFMEPGEAVSGSFVLITNCGEYQLPFSFYYPQTVLNSSLGDIKNLFHFTNLAKTNWYEAYKLFASSEFEKILANADKEYREIYRGLSGKAKEQHMDEFLQAIHKKEPVTYKIVNEIPELENLEETQKIETVIRRNGWGYTQLSVSVQGDFLAVEKENIREEDFMGNEYSLAVYVKAEKLHQGKNWGKLILQSPYEKLTLDILVYQKQHHRMRTAIEKRKNAKWLNAKLTNLYVDFRGKIIPAVRFKKESEEVLEALQKSDERNPLMKLYVAHLYMTQEKQQEAKWMLDRAIKYIQEERSPMVYAYYLYLTTFMPEEESYVNQVKEKVKELYYNYEDNWQIAWLWMYLSKELRSHPQKKWNFLKEVFQRGCTSPVMYMEALLLFNYQPTLVTELGKIELRILRYGQKKGMLTPEVLGVVQYLTMKEKEFSLPVYRLLEGICRENNNTELLQALCGLLIKGNKIGEDYLEWYEKAILAELKITRLYEYYMMSLDRDSARDIPRMVLLYFSYQPELNTEYAAYLYRYIYENKETLEDLYINYLPIIERFVLKKLYAGKIDRDLGYLYQNLLIPAMLTEDNAKALLKVLFVHEVSWSMKDGERMIVLYQQKQEEEMFTGHKDKMILPVYGKDYLFFREDSQGNRFLWKQPREFTAYMDIPKMAQQIMKWKPETPEFALYLCGEKQEWQNVTWEKENYFRFLSHCEAIKTEERMMLLSRLMEFYYEEDAGEKLDGVLEEMTPFSVAKEERKELLRYLIFRDYYEKAYEFVRIYGPETVDPKILVRICTYMLEDGKGDAETLLWYITTAFEKGKYNGCTLQYLVEHFKGSSKQMKTIFKAAKEFEVPTFPISERILKQILSTKAFIGEEVEIFKDYVSGGARTEIEAAFLTYRSLGYMKDDREMDPYLVRDIARVYKRGAELPLVTHLAYLRHFAEAEKRSYACVEILQEFLQEIVIEKEILLPFLLEYADMDGMEILADKTLISYTTTPKTRVVIHSRKIQNTEEAENFRREEMKEVCFGIYVKECLLFYGEELQYYITEEQENQEQLTKSGNIRKEETREKHKNSRYQMMNEMAIGQAMQDYETVSQIMEEYSKMEFIVDKVFHI